MTGPITIFQRICWAENAINAYSEDKEGGPWGELYDDRATVLVDLLADLMHYCDSYEIDFKRCVDSAEMHHDAEVAEEGGAS